VDFGLEKIVREEKVKFEALYSQTLKEKTRVVQEKNEMEDMFHEMVKKNWEKEKELIKDSAGLRQN